MLPRLDTGPFSQGLHLGGAEADLPPASTPTHPHKQGQLHCAAQTSVVANKGKGHLLGGGRGEGEEVPAASLSQPQGWLTHTPIYRVISTMLSRQDAGPVLLSATTGEGLGQVPHLLQVVKGGGYLSLTHTTTWHTKGAQPALLFSSLQGQP